MWGKYNLVKGGKPIIDCVKKEVKEVKDKSLLAYVAQYIHKEEIKKEFEKLIDDTYHDSLDSVSTIGGQKEKENKKVYILDAEEKLSNIFGTKVSISSGKKKGKIDESLF